MTKARRGGLTRKLKRFLTTEWRLPIGRIRRRFETFDEIVGVTGSAGKSTTTRMIGAILASRASVYVGVGLNTDRHVIVQFAKSSPRARYWIQELSGHERGSLRRSIEFTRPTVAVVTNVQFDHFTQHRDLDVTADTKGMLVEALGPDGIAILNADDPRVKGMAARTSARVLTFGQSDDADIRAFDWTEGLPERLSIGVTDGIDEVHLQTRFASARWIPNLLAAIACGKALGIPIAQSAEILHAVEPGPYRDSVHEKHGLTFVLDTAKNPYWSIPGSIEAVAKARYERRIMIFGTISDYPGSAGSKYRNAARHALEAADIVVFYGKQSQHVRKLVKQYPNRLHIFSTFEALKDFLNDTLKSGDLVYAKASSSDHLERVWYDANRPISCVRDYCGRQKACRRCRDL